MNTDCAYGVSLLSALHLNPRPLPHVKTKVACSQYCRTNTSLTLELTVQTRCVAAGMVIDTHTERL